MRRRAAARCLVVACAAAAAAFALPARAAADDGLDQFATTADVAIQAVDSDVAPSPTISAATAQVAAAAQAAAEEPQQPSQDVEAGVDAAVSAAISLGGEAAPTPEPPPPALSAPAVDASVATEVVSAPSATQIDGPVTAPAAAPALPAVAPPPPLATVETQTPAPDPDPAVAAPPAIPAQALPAVELPAVDAVQAPPVSADQAGPVPTAGPTPAEEPAQSQYQGDTSPSINSQDTSVPNSGLTWTWNWNWNCSDPTTGTSVISPSNVPGDTWLWDWNWSCGAEQAPPAPSCTGCNVAISIRLFSPGDDGDVTQSIVNTAETIASTVNNTVQQATQAVVQPPTVMPALPALPALPVAPPGLPAVVDPSSLGLMTAIVLPLALLPVEPELSMTLLAEAEHADTGVIPAASRHEPRRRAVLPASATVVVAPPPLVQAAEPAAAAGSAPPKARPTERRRSHHGPLRLPHGPPAPDAQLSVAPASSGTGSAGGVGLAILLGALLAASPPTARWLRTARERRHRAPVSRRPERPG